MVFKILKSINMAASNRTREANACFLTNKLTSAQESSNSNTALIGKGKGVELEGNGRGSFSYGGAQVIGASGGLASSHGDVNFPGMPTFLPGFQFWQGLQELWLHHIIPPIFLLMVPIILVLLAKYLLWLVLQAVMMYSDQFASSSTSMADKVHSNVYIQYKISTPCTLYYTPVMCNVLHNGRGERWVFLSHQIVIVYVFARLFWLLTDIHKLVLISRVSLLQTRFGILLWQIWKTLLSVVLSSIWTDDQMHRWKLKFPNRPRISVSFRTNLHDPNYTGKAFCLYKGICLILSAISVAR